MKPTPSDMADLFVAGLWDVIPHDSERAMKRRATIIGFRKAEMEISTKLPTALDEDEELADGELARMWSVVAAKMGY